MTPGLGLAGTLPDFSWVADSIAIRNTWTGLERYQEIFEPIVMQPWLSEIARQSQLWNGALAGHGLLAQQAAGIAARISGGLDTSTVILGDFAKITASISPPSWLPDLSSHLAHTMPAWLPADSFYGARFDALVRSLNTPTVPALQGFGALQHVIDSSPQLHDAMEDVADAARHPNGFGLNYDAVAASAEQVDAVLEREPEIVELLQQPLDATLAEAQIDQADVIRFGTVAGIWDRMRTHRVTGTGLVIGCTVGLLHYATSLAFAELNPTESLIYGAGVYAWVASTREGSS